MTKKNHKMKNKSAFFDAATITLLRGVLDDAWAHLPPGQTAVSQSLLAERILKAARAGDTTPPLRARAVTEGIACHPLRLDRDLVANILDIAVQEVSHLPAGTGTETGCSQCRYRRQSDIE